MPEILTESFCERCGTRYTFESTAPRKTRRLGQIKTLSKGMKNWVMSDDTSLDEAMAAARNDDDRELTSQQLDAFHATFNFCMTCRQYTCGNCWNAAEGHCLTCAPHLGQDVLPAPFPDQVVAFEPVRIDAESWPEVDLSVAEAADANGNGHVNGSGTRGLELDPWAQTGAASVEDFPEIDPAARLAFLSGEVPVAPAEPEPASAEPEPEAPTASIGWPEPEELLSFVGDESAVDLEPGVVDVSAEAIDARIEAAPAATGDAVAAVNEPAPIEAEPADLDAPAAAPDGWASTGAANTIELLRRFRPGQNIDAELAAFEAEQERVAEPLPQAPAAFAEDAPEPVEVPESAAAMVPEPVAMVEPEPEPVAAAAPEPEPVAIEATPAVEESATPSAPAVLSIGWTVPAAAPEPVAAVQEPAAAEPVAAEIHAPEPVASEPEPVVAEPEPKPIAAVAAEPEPVVAEPEPEPIAAVAAEPVPVAAEIVAAEPEPVAAEPEPVAAEPEPVQPAAPPREDRVPQPTWQIFAPDATPPESRPLVTPVAPAAPVQPPAVAGRDPQWPVRPDSADSPAMALLANRANRTSSDDLWAASSQQVLAHPATLANAAPTSGVQPCSSCGLSLSATARFCRRCGTRQG